MADRVPENELDILRFATKIIKKIKNIIPVQLKVLFRAYLSLVSLFALWRLIFLFFFLDDFDPGKYFLYLRSFMVALRLDSVVASLSLVLPALLIYLPRVGWPSQIFQRMMNTYMVLVFTGISLLCGIDLEWFNEFGNHLNTMVLIYGTGGKEAYELIWKNYPLHIYLICWIVIIYLFYRLFTKSTASLQSQFPGNYPGRTLSFLTTAFILVVLARGGFQERPVNWGYAHFSQDNMANVLAQNCVYFLGRSVLEYSSEKDLTRNVRHYDDETAKKIMADLSAANDRGRLDVSLPKPLEPSPNIMIIILESFVSENCNFLNPDLSENITPHLSRLSERGITFTRCFSNGIRSAYGIGALICSWPALPGGPIIYKVESSFEGNIAAQPMRILKELNYTNTFLYGGDANFDNMKGFAVSNGFDRVIDWNDAFFSQNSGGTMWGKYDHYLFEKVLDVADLDENPFFITVFTTTNHDPFTVPENYRSKVKEFDTGSEKYDRAKNTTAYVDLVINEFIEEAEKRDWFRNTIFVFTADHGLTVHRSIRNHPLNGHIPFIIYTDAGEWSVTVDKIVSQVDIIPTIMDLIGEEDKLDRLFGNSGLRTGDGFAFRATDQQLQWIENGWVYNELLGTGKSTLYRNDGIWETPYRIVNDDPSTLESVRRRCRAYVQTAFFDFKRNYSFRNGRPYPDTSIFRMESRG